MIVIEIMLCQWGLSNGYVLPGGRDDGLDRNLIGRQPFPLSKVFGHSEPADSGALPGLQMCP